MVVALTLLMFASGALGQQPDPEAGRRLLELVNGERQRAGVGRLEWDDRAAQAALRHAHWMVRYRELSHQFPGEPGLRQRLAAEGLRFNDDAENVAYDNSLEDAHANLMKSPGHRANILNPRFDAAGFAVIRQGPRVYVVENFVRRMPEISDGETAARILTEFNRARRAAGMKPVARKADLREAACHMARQDRVSIAGIGDLEARNMVAFTTFRPEDLPRSLEKLITETFSSVSIGACFARTPSYPSGTNWVVVVLYP